MRVSSVLGLLLSALLCQSLGDDPWTDGPYQTGHKTYHGFLNDGLSKELEVWYPSDGLGYFVPVYFLGGLGGVITATAYDAVMRHIASHGYIVLGMWAVSADPGGNFAGEWMVGMYDWVNTNLENRLHADGVSGHMRLDKDSSFLWGHSAGAHVFVEFMKHHCSSVKGSILFSPVDGFDPFGLVDMYAVTPGEYLNYDTPTLVLMTGLDNTPGFNMIGDIVPACAPEDLSNLRFYDALAGPTWLVNATAYGHADCLEDFYYNTLLVTHFCSTDSTQDREIYKYFVGGEIVAFIKATLDGECEYLQYIEDPAMMPVVATAQKKDSVAASSLGWECGKEAYCAWQEDPFP